MTHPPVLAGLRVLDLSQGIAGPVAAMLLGDYGADVVKVEVPGGDPFRFSPGYTVWMRGRRSVELDLKTIAGRDALYALVGDTDVFVESYAPGTTNRLGIDYGTLQALNDRLVYCSITGYGRHGDIAARPGYDALVQARSGIQNEQPGHRPGPIFLHAPLPSHGAALLASVGIHAALHTRNVTGRGQHVETSMMQGALLWMTQIWQRAESTTPALDDLWKFKHLGPTPCFEAGDGQWFHPMPQGVPVALAYLGRDPNEIANADLACGDLERRTAYFAAVRELYLQRPRDEWVELLQGSDVSCQPISRVEPTFDHPQIVNNRTVVTIDIPGVGAMKQFGHAYHLERHEERQPSPPPVVGRHNHDVAWHNHDVAWHHIDAATGAALTPPTPTPAPTPPSAPAMRYPLDGIRVLDFGTALAGPFAPMIMSDLGADVIKIDPLFQAGSTGDATYAACHRGKRSIAIDLKTPDGQAIAARLIATADVVHYNLRTGVAERLGFGYERAKAIKPDIIFCHLTAYGNTGPLAKWPGVDQMGQSLAGLEYDQGGTADGGHPTWYRYGMCDATSGMLSVLGVLQALGHRDRTGEGQAVEANIVSGAMLLASDAFVGPSSAGASSLPARPHLDRNQTGLGPLYRLYETSDGWVCIVVRTEDEWRALCRATGRLDLLTDSRFATASARDSSAPALATELEATFITQSADYWQRRLDDEGVPCETASIERGATWYDDAEVQANGWSVSYQHPVWGKLDHPGRFFSFSETPSRIFGPPPLAGQHTVDILTELGFNSDAIEHLRATNIVGW
jgi:crotonobetainyl-CoA:carnitine CoA-transferase CaiB-like acyl-CoA transferase